MIKQNDKYNLSLLFAPKLSIALTNKQMLYLKHKRQTLQLATTSTRIRMTRNFLQIYFYDKEMTQASINRYVH